MKVTTPAVQGMRGYRREQFTTPIEFIADEGGGFFVVCEGKPPLSNVPNNKSVAPWQWNGSGNYFLARV